MMAVHLMILLLTSILSELYGHETKNSVSFVIDTTKSMEPEIEEVKLQTRKLFDAIKSDKSQISELILVEFKDPFATVRAVTTDEDEFLNALSNLKVRGGGDCPEAALTGILLALEKSAPNSFIYVFTDSSAKDYRKFEEVKRLSMKKSIQITFLLTGRCKKEDTPIEYLVYHNIAIATTGQVFIMESKQNISKILEYIIESLKSKKTLLAQKLINTGPHNISFVMDTKVTTVMISVSGTFASNSVSVVDINGNFIECSVLVKTESVYVLQMPKTTRAGSYNITINSSKVTSVFVSGSTTICFEHGFSSDKPIFINETSKRPLPGIKSHLSIALTNAARDLLLETAELRDTDDNIITTVPLKLIDSEQQLYVTEQFDPPNIFFKIVIKGETNTRENITRVGMAYIEPQSVEKPGSKLAPQVTILGYAKVRADRKKPLTLKCKVEAYPKPYISWKNDLGKKFEPEVMIVELPSSFKSTLQIDRIDKNITYYCTARNSENTTTASVFVYLPEMKQDPPVIKTLGYVKNSTKGEMIDIECLIEGNPQPDVKWLKNSIKIENGTKYQIFENHTLRFKAMLDDSGNYSCKATNSMGITQRDFYINVYDPPVIKTLGYVKNSTKGETINIECLIEGNPQPDVKWLKNSIKIENGTKYQIFENHTLRFKATLDDSGNYSCKATNSMGKTQRYFYINVYVPVNLEITENATKVLKIGDKLSLRCSASGDPVPQVHLIFTNADEQKVLRNGRKEIYYSKKHVVGSDRGNYTCAASNHYSSERMVYNVTVIVPVTIEDSFPSIEDAVEGDKFLRLACKANGYPVPNITWIRNGEILSPSVNDRLFIEKDGALLIKNLTSDLRGNYTCSAENVIMGIRSTARKSYEVKILPFPDPESYPYTVTEMRINEGVKKDIECDIKHSSEEEIRWYKDQKYIKTGELSLDNPQKTDNGIYICRFSNSEALSESYFIKIIVVFKPRFLNETLGADIINIPYIENSTVRFDCEAEGYPEPKIDWYLDGILFKGIRSMKYYINHLQYIHVGIYKCEVKNDRGSISRIFNINSTDDCHLNIYDDFNDNQPLILLTNLRWPLFETTSGSVKVSKKKIVFYCPGGRLILERGRLSREDKVTAKCIRDTLFNVTGKAIKFSDLKCSKKIKPYVKDLKIRCIDRPNVLYAMGYMIDTKFLGVYDVCFDTVQNVPVFTKQTLDRYIAAKVPKREPRLETYENIKYNFKGLYNNMSEQIKLLRRHFDSNSCLFSERQLVNPLDMRPGMSQVTTYNYLNIMPHWSPCYNENWSEVEKKVREVAQSLSSETIVWTGTSDWIPIQSLHPGAKGTGLQRQLVPLFLWKVVQNYEQGGSVAIVQINSPTLTQEEVENKVKCYDICNKIKWLRNDEWHNVTKGYTYCCNITEFEQKFHFNLLFRAASVDVLYSVPKSRTRS